MIKAIKLGIVGVVCSGDYLGLSHRHTRMLMESLCGEWEVNILIMPTLILTSRNLYLSAEFIPEREREREREL